MSSTDQYQTLPTSKPPKSLPPSREPPAPPLPKRPPPIRSKKSSGLKYGLVVVFCAGEPYIDSETQEIYLPETEFKDNVNGEIYVGCRQRLEATIKLANQTETMILVGGSFDKVEAMHQYLARRDVSSEKLYLLESHPSTIGNLWALRKLLDKMEEIPIDEQPFVTRKTRRIHFLANAWHIHRIMAFATDIIPYQYQLVPLVAEAFQLPSANILNTLPYYNRLENEFEGLYDYYHGNYQNQDQPYEFWKSILHFPK
jgi:hypothetical protein